MVIEHSIVIKNYTAKVNSAPLSSSTLLLNSSKLWKHYSYSTHRKNSKTIEKKFENRSNNQTNEIKSFLWYERKWRWYVGNLWLEIVELSPKIKERVPFEKDSWNLANKLKSRQVKSNFQTRLNKYIGVIWQ